MKKIKISDKKKWATKFKKRHSDIYDEIGSINKLRLILGVGRSGTTWLGNVLASSETPLRYVQEAFPHMRTKYIAEKTNDPLALPYIKNLSANHPFIIINKALSSKSLNENFFLEDYYKRKMPRADKNYDVVIHKEVHALLAAEGFINSLNCPVITISRNPVYVIDSLMAYQDLTSPIWRNEQKYIKDDVFLDEFFPFNKQEIKHCIDSYPDDGRTYLNVIVGKAITVAVINKYLQSLAERYHTVKHVTYEDLCTNTENIFAELANFFSISFKETAQQFLKSTQEGNEINIHSSIFKDTKEQANRVFKSITTKEEKIIKDVLNRCRLYEYA